MPKLSQETIAIVSVGATVVVSIVALAAIVITLNGDIRTEIQAMRAEARADREAWQEENRRIRDEARDDREAWQAEMRALREDAGTDREAVSRLSGIVEQMRTTSR